VHSEINAIAQAAKHGTRIDGATAYVTLSPCYNCFKALVNAGVTRIVFDEAYRIPLDAEMVRSCGVAVEQIGGAL
jgi:dCMP deaminase